MVKLTEVHPQKLFYMLCHNNNFTFIKDSVTVKTNGVKEN